MKFWIRVNGLQEGPMDIDQLKEYNITPTTYVWCAGMKDWAYARDVVDLQDLFTDYVEINTPAETLEEISAETEPEQNQEQVTESVPVSEIEQNEPQPQVTETATPQNTSIEQTYEEKQSREERPCPPNNLIWGILITIFCCQPLAILAIIFSAQVGNKYYEEGYEAAKKYSNWAGIICIISIVLSILLCSVFYPLMLFLSI